MSNSRPVLLILGSGPNIGQHVARSFTEKGYKVALASRTPKEADNTTDQLRISSDLSDPNAVIDVFTKVKASLGLPSVVIYNGKSNSLILRKNPNQALLLTNPKSRRANPKRCKASTLSPFGQLHSRHEHQYNQRLRRRATSRSSLRPTPRGCLENIHLHGQRIEHDDHSTTTRFGCRQVSDGTHHSISRQGLRRPRIQVCHFQFLDTNICSVVEIDQYNRFYYADERKADGSPAVNGVDGEAHGKLYVQLAEDKAQGPWQQTFVKGMGYKSFPV